MDWRARLADYLHRRLPAAERVSVARASSMTRGASNDTVLLDIEVVCDGCLVTVPLVLRPQRQEGILAPYDVERQFRVMRALSRTAVPVPPVAWFERDPTVLGAPFFLMARLDASSPPLFWYGGRTPELDAIADALAKIHAVDWRAVGLSFLLPGQGPGPLPSPLVCDLAAWDVRAAYLGLDGDANLARLREFLLANEPTDARHALLHGDPNPGNYLLRDGRVAGVVDWELAAIGDPRSDLGFYAALMTVFGGGPGRGSRTVLAEAYEGVTGVPLAALEYYEAVGLYKMAIVAAGWGMFGWGGYTVQVIESRLASLLGPRWAA
ncbi:MAG: phosphotransferase family protein [Dehalococcoidia bacterium]